ncbi:MAG: PQQ-binding-like beta-propeller repeat protein [Planctomycetia bacterium]|nr:PQQ-binding-like beta-propeller repeat protein [Planctomycetia bacterium]
MMTKFRSLAGLVLAGMFLCSFACVSVWGQSAWRGNIIPQNYLNSRGLQRQWTTQIQINTARDRLSQMILDRGTIFTVTENGSIQATNAETGATLWTENIASKGKLVQGLSANTNYVGFTCGSTLYIFNRMNGKPLLDVEIEAIPTAGLILGQGCAYIPCVDGNIYAFDLQPMEDPFAEFGVTQTHLSERERKARRQEFIDSLRLNKTYEAALAVRALGYLTTSPTFGKAYTPQRSTEEVSEEFLKKKTDFEYVAWPTTSQTVTLIEVDFRGENITYQEIESIAVLGDLRAPLSYRPYRRSEPDTTGFFYAATTAGFVYAIREETGNVLWRFPTGEAIHQTPTYVDNDLFIVTAISGMYCIDAVSGGDGNTNEAKWWSPDIQRFLSCSKNRIYAMDKHDSLVILDRVSGQKISSIPITNIEVRLTNTQTDRIYLATNTGLIQCLRESALETPLDFQTEPKQEKRPKLADVNLSGDDADEEEEISEDETFEEEDDGGFSDEEEDVDEESLDNDEEEEGFGEEETFEDEEEAGFGEEEEVGLDEEEASFDDEDADLDEE